MRLPWMATGSIIDGQFTGIVYLSDELSAWNVLPLDQVVEGSPKGLHVVTRFEDMEPGPWKCGVTGPGPAAGARMPVAPPETTYYCDVAIEADYPYYVQVGGTASTVAHDISTVVANVTSYSILSGTNLRFRVVRYVIRVTAQGNPAQYATTNPNTLLSGFQLVWNNLAGAISRDTAHMFTGRRLDGSTIGIAYIAAVCNTQFAYGVSESRFNLQPGRRAALTAHELGHNFSAYHCDAAGHLCTPCWLMLATQGNTTNELTRYGCSTTVIGTYAAGQSCLGPSLLRTGRCPGDFNGDGALTPADLIAFHTALLAGDMRADADGDGRLTVADFVVFLNEFAAGCP